MPSVQPGPVPGSSGWVWSGFAPSLVPGRLAVWFCRVQLSDTQAIIGEQYRRTYAAVPLAAPSGQVPNRTGTYLPTACVPLVGPPAAPLLLFPISSPIRFLGVLLPLPHLPPWFLLLFVSHRWSPSFGLDASGCVSNVSFVP